MIRRTKRVAAMLATTMARPQRLDRRRFLKGLAAAGAAPLVLRAASLAGPAAPGNRITLGFIGLGWKGFEGCWGSLLQAFIAYPDCRVLAVCDVDRRYRDRAKAFVDQTYGDSACAAVTDFREIIARPDIDAVVIAAPDHWHAVMTIWACREGKDVYCEKPLALTIREGRMMVEAARRYGRVVQTGSQSRSNPALRTACAMVREGRIGTVREVHAGCGGPSSPCRLPGEPAPDYLDWDLWLGPAPWRPYNAQIHPRSFRGFYDYSGGGMTDWGCHHFDLAQWGLGTDLSGPVEVIPPGADGHSGVGFRYAGGTVLYHRGGGVTFFGSEGRINVHGISGTTRFEPASLSVGFQHEVVRMGDRFGNKGHYEDFLDAVRARRRPNADVEIGHRSLTIGLIGNVGYALKRPLQWDPAQEAFVGDDEANRHLDRARRAPWII